MDDTQCIKLSASSACKTWRIMIPANKDVRRREICLPENSLLGFEEIFYSLTGFQASGRGIGEKPITDTRSRGDAQEFSSEFPRIFHIDSIGENANLNSMAIFPNEEDRLERRWDRSMRWRSGSLYQIICAIKCCWPLNNNYKFVRYILNLEGINL